MDQPAYRVGGDLTLPIAEVSLADLPVILAPLLLTYRLVSDVHPLLGLAAGCGAALLGRLALFGWRRAFPGKAFPQLLAWLAQADHYAPKADARTQRARYP